MLERERLSAFCCSCFCSSNPTAFRSYTCLFRNASKNAATLTQTGVCAASLAGPETNAGISLAMLFYNVREFLLGSAVLGSSDRILGSSQDSCAERSENMTGLNIFTWSVSTSRRNNGGRHGPTTTTTTTQRCPMLLPKTTWNIHKGVCRKKDTTYTKWEL